MSQKQNFIMTMDKQTADKLIAAGFTMLRNNGGTYVFLNTPSNNFTFSSIDKTKFCFTNILGM
jgi:hypothetical protein